MRDVADDAEETPASESPRKRLRRGQFAWVARVTERLRAVMRVMTYAMVVCMVIAFFALRSAYGDVKESALVIGRELAGFGDLLGKSSRVLLNGEPIYVSSAMTDQSVEQVLDRFEGICKKSGNGLAKEFSKLPEQLKEQVREELGEEEDEDGSGLGVMRGSTSRDGMVACLVQSPGQRDKEMIDRLTEFVETGDLSKVGWLRYAYAKKTENGRTHVVTSWTDGAFRVFNLMPEDGKDAPGSDPRGTTRPERAARILSAEIEGAPHSVRIYDSKAAVNEVLAGYDREMPKLGWERLPFVHEEVKHGRAFSREGVDTLVFVYENRGGSLISMVQTRSD